MSEQVNKEATFIVHTVHRAERIRQNHGYVVFVLLILRLGRFMSFTEYSRRPSTDSLPPQHAKQIFQEKELRGLSPNFHIHVSVSDFKYSHDRSTYFPAAE
jgi:hypothetical protein